ncbi:CinA family protein [Stratiformator vulcanicus]|uniref:Nicotinamide-nucleotide amidohydrolase PncC n=1 Tax=Stratiformator vulcanicus TaxID=2527980 RepID=A0A517R4F9_9PLAN|nr:CinA family protein [Stratiformator vulcanicus]QDT38774.1 Nicotinamide-nucleotide amidohydrolase PncC [Stratiformator vulcanicus]
MNHNSFPTELDNLAANLLEALRGSGDRLVLAESCTGGLIATAITRQPGASQVFAGSAVVYQEATKSAWLGIAPDFIDSHGVVSREVAQAMARGVLSSTPHATVALAVTGHLGPNAPAGQDGVIFIGTGSTDGQTAERYECRSLPQDDPLQLRRDRQIEVAAAVLRRARSTLVLP